MVVIVDYGVGNSGSIANMLKKLGHKVAITDDASTISKATKLILPGVGAFDYAMKKLKETNLIETLNECILTRKIPILGICLGMQVMGKCSEEGELPGLGWVDCYFKKFSFEQNSHKIPHMGWNYITKHRVHPLFQEMPEVTRFYFVHSFHAVCEQEENVLAEAEYGYPFTAAIVSENIMGVQFHPEKSHMFGLQLLKNFVERC